MNASAVLDEVVIASSDADFTPLLQRLRAEDRRTMIIAAGSSSPSYRSVANSVLDSAGLVDLLLGTTSDDSGSDDSGRPQGGDAPLAVEPERTPTPVNNGHDLIVDDAQTMAANVVFATLDASNGPILLAQLGILLRKLPGSREGGWFGQRTLVSFVRSIAGDRNIQSEGHHLWDGDRHQPPVIVASNETAKPLLPQSVAQLCRVTGLPPLGTESWQAVFATLAEYLATQRFEMPHCTAWCRDQLADSATPVGRSAMVFTVNNARLAGIRFNDGPPASAETLATAVITVTIDKAQAAGLALSDEDETELRSWLGQPTEPPPILPATEPTWPPPTQTHNDLAIGAAAAGLTTKDAGGSERRQGSLPASPSQQSTDRRIASGPNPNQEERPVTPVALAASGVA